MEIQEIKRVVEEVVVKAIKEHIVPGFVDILARLIAFNKRFDQFEKKLEQINKTKGTIK